MDVKHGSCCQRLRPLTGGFKRGAHGLTSRFARQGRGWRQGSEGGGHVSGM